jgi:hypothetical protein
MRLIDRRSKAAKDLIVWQNGLRDDRTATVRRTRIETVSRTKLLLDDLDAYLLAHRRLVERGRKGMAPVRVVRLLALRQSMADSLDRILAGLGGDHSAGSRDRARGRRDVTDPPSSIAELVAQVGGGGTASAPQTDHGSPA